MTTVQMNYLYFFIALLIGIPLGYFGFGIIAYFGLFFLLAILYEFIRHKKTRTRLTLLGLLLGTASSFFITLQQIGWHE